MADTQVRVVVSAVVDDFKNKMKEVSQRMEETGKKVKGIGEKMSKMGDKVSGVGKSLSKGITAPLGAAAGAAFKFANDQENAFAQVKTLLTGSEGDFQAYKKEIRKASGEMGVSMEDYSASVYGAISAGQSQADAIGFVADATKLAKGGFTDTANAVDVLTTAINAYGLESGEASKLSDMLITTQNLGKTTVDALSASMGAVIPVAQAQGVTFDQLSAGYAVLTKNGIATAEAGTYMKSMFGELGKSGSKVDKVLREETGKSFSELQASGMNTGEVLNVLSGVADKSGLKLSDMFGSVEAGSAALVLAKDGASEFDDFLGQMGSSAGATEKAFATMADTTGEKMKKAWTKIKNVGASLGDNFLPIVAKVADKVGAMTEKFSDISPEMQKAVIVFGAIAAVIPPIIVGIGSVISAVGGIATAFGGMTAAVTGATGAATLAGAAIAALTSPIGLAIAGAAALGVGIYKFAKHMSKDAIPEVDRFGEEVSESTKKALGAYFELSDGASQSLMQLKLSQGTVTDAMAKELVGKYGEMNSQVLAKLDERNKAQTAKTKEMFANSAALTDEEEKKILEKQKASQDAEIKGIEAQNKQIQAIIQKASGEKRKMTEEEYAMIDRITQESNNKAVETLSANEVETAIIRERMKEQAGNMTALQAAEVAANSYKQKEAAVTAANEQYDGTLAEIIRMRDETGVISGEQAEKLITDAQKTRDDSVAAATESHAGIVEQAKLQAGEHAAEVDWETGTVLSKWDMYKKGVKERFDASVADAKSAWGQVSSTISQNWSKGWERTKTDAANIQNTASKAFSAVSTFATTGFGQMARTIGTKFGEGLTTTRNKTAEMVSTAGRKFSEMATTVSSKMGNVKTAVSIGWGKVTGFLSGINLRSIGSNIIQGLAGGITSAWGHVSAAVSGIATKIKNKFTSMFKMASPSKLMRDEYGFNIGAGVGVGIKKSGRMVEQAAEWLANKARIKPKNMNFMPSLDYGGTVRAAGAVALSGVRTTDSPGRYDEDRDRSYRFDIPVEIDGREVARASATYTEQELDRMKTNRQRSRGVVTR